MKAIVFDSSTIINFALNNMLWLLAPLKKQYKGEFYITKQVKQEIVDRPSEIRRFKLESMQIQEEINKGNLKVYEEDISQEILELTKLANAMFLAKETFLKLVDEGEISALVLAKKINAEAIIVDERTTKLLIESPETLANIFRDKLHVKLKIDQDKLKQIKQRFSNIPVLRSTELGIAAYELGFLDNYTNNKNKSEVLDAFLWGMKLHGCAITENEIFEIINLEK